MNKIFSKYYNKKILIIFGILTVIIFLTLRNFDVPLHTSAAPNGILSFEFAKSIEVSNQILDSWDTNAKTNAGLSLGIDFLFLLFYSIFLSIAVYLLGKRYSIRYSFIYSIGSVLAYLLLIAGIFDAIENIALIKLLLGSINEVFSSIAFYFASMKFSIIGFGLLYIILCLFLKLSIKIND